MTLHIYAQACWHDEAYISGTRETLEMLRAAIDRALADGHGQMQAFTNDGEGYRVHVMPVSEEDADRMCVPYTDEIAKAPAGEQFGPWTLLRSNAEITGRASGPG